VSESASTPRAALSVPDPTQAQVPPQLWLRSGRPMFGTAVRVYVAFALVAGALIFVSRGPVFWGLLGAGVLAFMLFPAVIQGLLAPLERRVLAAGRREATALLQEVRARGLVRRFAPHAWLTLQEGRLHLRRGDGRAAARAFAETQRLSRGADAPALVSAQAHALVLAEQPEQARELLQALGRRQALNAGDQLQLGLALLGGKGNGREALAHVQAAQAGLGDLPRVLAALALALHRADQPEAALVALKQAQDSLGPDPDPFDEALVQRGVKLLRAVQKAQERRERKAEGKRTEAVARVAAPDPAKPGAEPAASAGKSARKAKKEERRASRRAAKAEKRTAEPARASKAAKIAPKGKAARAVEPRKLAQAVEVKPVEVVKSVDARPVEVKAVEVRPVEVKAVEAKAVEVRPVEVKSVEVKSVEVKSVEVKSVEVKPVEVVKAAARVEAPRPPAPPSGTALFGTLGAKPVTPAPGFGAPPPSGLRLPPRPTATPQVSASSPPLRPPAPVAAPAVPKVMSPPAPGASPGLAARSVVPPPVAGVPTPPVAPPVGPVAAPAVAAPAMRPAVPVPTLSGPPPLAPVPTLSGPPPLAPVLAPPSGLAPRVAGAPPPALAQVLPDTDDGWDEMLDALEADSARG